MLLSGWGLPCPGRRHVNASGCNSARNPNRRQGRRRASPVQVLNFGSTHQWRKVTTNAHTQRRGVRLHCIVQADAFLAQRRCSVCECVCVFIHVCVPANATGGQLPVNHERPDRVIGCHSVRYIRIATLTAHVERCDPTPGSGASYCSAFSCQVSVS